jgi:hypothetical protein
LNALRFLFVFLAVSIVAGAAFITAAFIFWYFVPAQPGTATALTILFLVGPGFGIVSGLAAAIQAVRPPAARIGGSGGHGRWLAVALAAIIGWLGGFGLASAAIDLSYPYRSDLLELRAGIIPLIPALAGMAVATAMASLVLRLGGGAVRAGTNVGQAARRPLSPDLPPPLAAVPQAEIVLGVLHVLTGLTGLAAGLVLLAVWPDRLQQSTGVQAIHAFVIFVLISIALLIPLLAGGFGLMAGRPFGRAVALVTSLLLLALIPFGTALGIAGFVILRAHSTSATLQRTAGNAKWGRPDDY